MSGPPKFSPQWWAQMLTPPERRDTLDREVLSAAQRDWQARKELQNDPTPNPHRD